MPSDHAVNWVLIARGDERGRRSVAIVSLISPSDHGKRPRGFVAGWLAAEHPDRVDRLVFADAASSPSTRSCCDHAGLLAIGRILASLGG